MENSNVFALRLSELCKSRDSIAEICRDLNVNRQQFARYLNGQRMPRYALQNKIAEYFGTTVAALHTELGEPIEQVSTNEFAQPNSVMDIVNMGRFQPLGENDVLAGWYLQFKSSFLKPDKVFVSVAKIDRIDGNTWYSHRPPRRLMSSNQSSRSRFQYSGLFQKVGNRIVMFEGDAFAEGIVFSSFAMPVFTDPGLLNGVHMSTSPALSTPAAARIVLRKLAPKESLKTCVKRYGFHDFSTLSEDERQMLLGDESTSYPGQIRI